MAAPSPDPGRDPDPARLGDPLYRFSRAWLLEILDALGGRARRSVGLMGGWGVHYLLASRGVRHVPSRDIDLFFDPREMPYEQVRDLAETLGFVPSATFRFVKHVDYDTGRVLGEDEARRMPLHEMLPVFLDLASPTAAGRALVEPLLHRAFAGESALIAVEGRRVIVPQANLLIGMKLRSSVDRPDPEKRSKDLADIWALLESHPELWIDGDVGSGGIRPGIMDEDRRRPFREALAGWEASGIVRRTAGIVNRSFGVVTRYLRTI